MRLVGKKQVCQFQFVSLLDQDQVGRVLSSRESLYGDHTLTEHSEFTVWTTLWRVLAHLKKEEERKLTFTEHVLLINTLGVITFITHNNTSIDITMSSLQMRKFDSVLVACPRLSQQVAETESDLNPKVKAHSFHYKLGCAKRKLTPKNLFHRI